MAASPWPVIATERKALADDLADLTDKQWATASLCDGWNVQQALAHMIGAAETAGPLGFFPKLAGAGFSLNKLNEKNIADRTKGNGADTLKHFVSIIGSKKHPPGPVDTWLGETIVHAEDIRRPLKISHSYDEGALKRLADFYRKSNLVIRGKSRVAGLSLKATDSDWTAGSGPEVAGPLASLVCAIAGRPSAFKDLKGPGVDTMASR